VKPKPRESKTKSLVKGETAHYVNVDVSRDDKSPVTLTTNDVDRYSVVNSGTTQPDVYTAVKKKNMPTPSAKQRQAILLADEDDDDDVDEVEDAEIDDVEADKNYDVTSEREKVYYNDGVYMTSYTSELTLDALQQSIVDKLRNQTVDEEFEVRFVCLLFLVLLLDDALCLNGALARTTKAVVAKLQSSSKMCMVFFHVTQLNPFVYFLNLRYSLKAYC
jgi:hypothetical protein